VILWNADDADDYDFYDKGDFKETS